MPEKRLTGQQLITLLRFGMVCDLLYQKITAGAEQWESADVKQVCEDVSAAFDREIRELELNSAFMEPKEYKLDKADLTLMKAMGDAISARFGQKEQEIVAFLLRILACMIFRQTVLIKLDAERRGITPEEVRLMNALGAPIGFGVSQEFIDTHPHARQSVALGTTRLGTIEITALLAAVRSICRQNNIDYRKDIGQFFNEQLPELINKYADFVAGFVQEYGETVKGGLKGVEPITLFLIFRGLVPDEDRNLWGRS